MFRVAVLPPLLPLSGFDIFVNLVYSVKGRLLHFLGAILPATPNVARADRRYRKEFAVGAG